MSTPEKNVEKSEESDLTIEDLEKISTPISDKVELNIEEAEKAFEEEELQNAKKFLNWIVFNEKQINKVIIGAIKSIDYVKKRIELSITKNKTVHEHIVSFKHSSLKTQIETLQFEKGNIIAIKYLGKKPYKGNLVNSFVVKKYIATTNGNLWITCKEI